MNNINHQLNNYVEIKNVCMSEQMVWRGQNWITWNSYNRCVSKLFPGSNYRFN